MIYISIAFEQLHFMLNLLLEKARLAFISRFVHGLLCRSEFLCLDLKRFVLQMHLYVHFSHGVIFTFFISGELRVQSVGRGTREETEGALWESSYWKTSRFFVTSIVFSFYLEMYHLIKSVQWNWELTSLMEQNIKQQIFIDWKSFLGSWLSKEEALLVI